MRALTLILSLSVLFVITSDFFSGSNDSLQNKKYFTESSVNTPSLLGKAVLPVEKHWLSLKVKRESDTEQSSDNKQHITNKKVLAIGEQNYQLYGIFNKGGKPFILLRDENSAFIKLRQGDVLYSNVALIEIDVDRIVFTKNDERIEFKLFERKTHENNQ